MSRTLVAGLDVGGTKILGVAVAADDPGSILAEHRVPTPAALDDLAAGIAGVVEALEQTVDDAIDAVGVGVPGLVDRHGVMTTAPNLGALSGVDVRGTLGDALHRPVHVDNDATVATLAEHRVGAGRGVDDLIFVALGTGIGAGIVMDGEVRRGAHGFAGEIGHHIVDFGGPKCPCGRSGCWERFAAGSSLVMFAERDVDSRRSLEPLSWVSGANLRSEDVMRQARAGNHLARTYVDEWAHWIAIGLTNIATIFDPELLVLGGGVIDDADMFLDATRAEMERLALSHTPTPRLAIAELGSKAAAIGAALLALD